MKNDLVSIIIPVYNAEIYLHKCIDSILAQTYNNFEIIIVDDGSCDNSSCIIKNYNDKRIKYIYSKHFGVSTARNMGIKAAKGKYISFIDSDDEICPEFLEYMLSSFTEQNELVMCSYTKNIKKYTSKKEKIRVDSQTAYQYILQKNIEGFVWNKIFLKEIIDKHNLTFSEKLSMGEDILFLAQYLKYSKNIKIDFNKYYFYRKNENQVTRKFDESISSVLYGWIGVIEIYQKKCPKFKAKVEYEYLKNLAILKKVIKRDFSAPKIKIDIKKMKLYQRLNLTLYTLFATEIVFFKKHF